MNWRKFWRSASQWFKGRQVLVLEQVDEIPDRLAKGKLYLLGEGRHLWAVAMQCPCSCGDIIHLNLLLDARPCWRLIKHRDGTVSLSPSIWRQGGCLSHFFIRNNRVEWFRPAGLASGGI